jgi:hypothetical protein
MDNKFLLDELSQDECIIDFINSIKTNEDNKIIIIKNIKNFSNFIGKSPIEC